MTVNEIEKLNSKIRNLERELQEKSADLDLYKNELTKANDEIKKLILTTREQLDYAQKIQKILVPTEFPNIPGFEFSSKFIASMVSGGDFFDIFDQSDKFRFGVSLGSCKGYTLSALLMSVLMKYSSSIRQAQNEPDEVFKIVCREIEGESLEPLDLSFLFAAIDRREYKMKFSLSGEISAFHFQYAQGGVEKLQSNCDVKARNFTNTEVSLNPRDKLIFCSQGISSRVNSSGEEFGSDNLFALVKEHSNKPIHELKNEILYSIESHSDKFEAQRDQTVVLLEVKDRVIKLAKM